MKLVDTLFYSALFVYASSQISFAIDISATGHEDPVTRICIEGETEERRDFSPSEQIEACSEIIARDDEMSSSALLHRAWHYEDLRRWNDAHKDFDALVSLSPQNPSAWYNRAKSTIRIYGPSQQVLDDLSKAIALTQDRPRARYFAKRAGVMLKILEKDAQKSGKIRADLVVNIHRDLLKAQQLDESGISELSDQIRNNVDTLLAWTSEQLKN